MSDEESSSGSSSSSEHYNSDDELESPSSPSKSPRKQGNSILIPSAFDAYFTHHAPSTKQQTSANALNALITPLSAEEYTSLAPHFSPNPKGSVLLEPMKSEVFDRMMFTLDCGFNVLGYGYGSKRALLNDFAMNRCGKRGHVAVMNAFLPSFSFKAFLESIVENLPVAPSAGSVEGLSQAIDNHFLSEETKHPLYIIAHNIDSPALRAARPKGCMAMLAMNPNIHLVASVDHINSALLFSSSEAFARKDEKGSRGFGWMHFDLTTLQPYDTELAWTDKGKIDGASKKMSSAASGGVGGGGVVDESSALHVLASVTLRAKKLFVIIAKRQLDAEDSIDPTPSSPAKGKKDQGKQQGVFSIPYDQLFHAARDEFLASADSALRALLGEFRDHALVVGEESLRIPMRKERLRKVVGKIEAELAAS